MASWSCSVDLRATIPLSATIPNWRKLSMLLTVLICLGNMGCAKKARGDNCIEKFTNAVQVGTSQAEAERALDKCGFTHSFDQKTSTIYGLKHGQRNMVTREEWSARIKLDETRKVASVKVERVFTGP